MNELQGNLLEIMKFFHNVCQKNDIRYYLLGGSCLGAVRHKGFIPWDDDIDVGVPRKDYDKLIEAMKKIKDERYVLECPLENKDFVYSFCKIYDTQTVLIENTRYKTRRGAYLDIFPLDGAGDSRGTAIKHFNKINRMNNYVSTKTCAINKNRAFYKNAAIILGRCIPEFVFGWRWAYKKIDALCRSKDFDESIYVGNMHGAWREREIMERSVFGQPRLYDFEGCQFYGPENADLYLTTVYGNYMTLPPKEKQVTHHDFLFLDLNKSYKE